MLVHHHFIYQGEVNRKDINETSGQLLIQFLYDLTTLIKMEVLIAPAVAFSQHKAWTGLIGIVTSHISFHYWTIEQRLQLDIYSCKAFDVEILIHYLRNFWQLTEEHALFIKREFNQNFKITNLNE
jgi:S-adenosylmethionine/arginine decarboxylase-like enzyme